MKWLFGKWLCLVVAVAVVAFALAPSSSSGAAAEKTRRVLIIGIDGATPAVAKTAKTPNIKSLAENGTVTWDGFAGGVLGTPSRQNTASMASWNSILTGVWANKHKGARMLKGRPLPADHANYPCIFQRVKQADPKAYCSSIVNWPTINQVMAPAADYKAKGKNDAEVVELASKHLQEADPAVLFIQLDEVDGAGHGNGYTASSPKYVEAVERADKYVGDLVAAVKNRKNYANEDWLIILVSDHGGKANAGGGHGGDSPEERTIFIVVSGNGAKKGAVVSPGPGIVAVTPTALKFLGVEIKKEWNLDAEPFGLKD
ncbi:MAG TPA: alkaline phosphatase family protein [Phycisphaerae bacterium]|nr:alkaline phosphatase family protein [Phycisphaerae bacterium]